MGGDEYTLTWESTWVQLYRTGRPEYDKHLEQYDHILHKYSDDGENADWVIITFDQIGSEGLEFLLENGYKRHIDPIPEPYILAYMASRVAEDIPEAIGPDFGLI